MRRCEVIWNLIWVLAAGGTSARAAVDITSITATLNGAPNPGRLVQINYTGTLGTENFSNYSMPVYAGQINWHHATGTDSSGTLLSMMPTSFSSLGTFSGYCIDVTQNIYQGIPYTYTGLTDNLSASPVISLGSGYAGMGAAAAMAVQNLYADEYDIVATGGQAIQYDANPDDTDSDANDQSAAFQIALWDLIYGVNSTPSAIDVTDSTNGFWISNGASISSFNEIAGMADQFAQSALGGLPQTFEDELLVMNSPTLSDQLVVGLPTSENSPPFPAPSSVIIEASLLLGVSVRRWRRQVR